MRAPLRLLLAAAVLLAAVACRPPEANPLAEWSASPNQDARRPVMVILHHTAGSSLESALKTLKTANSGGPVSSHYLLGRDGRLVQLVLESRQAWHAGGGSWGPYRDVNAISIGIEIDNNGFEPFPEPQIQALITLLKDIAGRYKRMSPRMVLGHADVDPVRKVDPHPQFPWKRLADAGLGLWPQGELVEPPAGFDPWLALGRIGYPLKDPTATLRAFHIHYRATDAGELDDVDRKLLFNLEQQITPRPPAPPAPEPPAEPATR